MSLFDDYAGFDTSIYKRKSNPKDLKGIDTGKIGNNKYVNYTLKDFERDQDVSRAGALDLLGGVKLEGLTPIAPTLKKPETIREKIRSFIGKGPAGTETELVGGKVVGKDRPDNIITRPLAGLLDFATFGVLDTDQRGNLFGGTHSTSGYGGGQELDYKLPKVIKEQLAKADKVEKEKENFDPYADLDKLLDYELKYKKATDAMDRKGRAADVAMEMANIRANMPFITNTMKDLSTFKQRQLLDAEKIKQALPNAQQARLLAADQGFKTQADAIANQQDAATRMAGLGMQRQFGQNVVFTPPLLRG